MDPREEQRARRLREALAVRPRAAPEPANLTRMFMLGMFVIAAVGLVTMLFRPEEQRITLITNVGVLLEMMLLHAIHRRYSPAHPIRFVGVFAMLLMVQPASIILATALVDPLEYYTEIGVYSQHLRAARVAAVHGAFFAAVILGSLLVGEGRRSAQPVRSMPEALRAVAPIAMRAIYGVAVATAVIRLLLIFEAIQSAAVLSYLFRVFLAATPAAAFFVGAGVRNGQRDALYAGAVLGVVFVLVLFTGSRWDALLPALSGVIGYALAAPVARRKLYVATAGLAVMAWMLISVGAAVRGDSRGRSGAAAIERLGRLGSGENPIEPTEDDRPSALLEPVLRFVRNSSHAVITMIPETHPFEAASLSDLPAEIRSRALPQLNLGGRASEEAPPRVWLLRDFGFILNAGTGVEFAVVPDAWYRGGWAAVLAIGFYLGCFLTIFDRLAHRGADRRPLRVVFLVLTLPAVASLDGQDFVAGTRALLLIALTNAAIVAAAAWLVSSRRNPGVLPSRARALAPGPATPDATTVAPPDPVGGREPSP